MHIEGATKVALWWLFCGTLGNILGALPPALFCFTYYFVFVEKEIVAPI